MDAPSRDPRFPPLDPSTYGWSQSSRSPRQWRRPALAGESLWIPRPKDYHEMFIGGSLTLCSVALPSPLVVAVKAAWRRLRFEVPELVVGAGYGPDGEAYMQYQEPASEEEVGEWVERTTNFDCSNQGLDFQLLLENIRRKKEGHDSDQVSLFVHPVVEGSDGLVKRIDFVLNADHQVVDGIGIRILLHHFLVLLAESFSRNPALKDDANWKESVPNLTPPWISLVNENQLLSGPEYERVAEFNEDVLFQKMPQNPGLPLLSTPQTPTQKTHFITLTKIQSTRLLQSIKHLVGSDSNITHLAHAAMVLALLRSNPPSSYSQTLYSPCWLNGRRYLKPFPGHPTPTTSYIPICQSFAPVIFDNLSALTLPSFAERGELKSKLIKACKVATAEYGKIRKRKSMLPECVVLLERLGKNMYLKQQLEMSSGERTTLPPSPVQSLNPDNETSDQQDTSSVQTNGLLNEPPVRTADPFFLSDGITEQYINHEYFDSPASDSKRRVFEVDDIAFAANAEKNLIVRMSSWRGKVTVSGEWKECDYDGAMIIRFLEDMVGIMLSLIEQD